MARERLVIDTNVLISGILLPTSTPARAFDKAVAQGQVLVTTGTLAELVEKIASSKFDRYLSQRRRELFLRRFTAAAQVVSILHPIRACRDPKDDKFLEAVNGRADAIITGDKDLLELHPFRGVAILRPAEYLRRQPR